LFGTPSDVNAHSAVAHLADVAVPAEELEVVFGEPTFSQPQIDHEATVEARLPTMLRSVVVLMVNLQERLFFLSAAGTFSPISSESLSTNARSPSLRSLIHTLASCSKRLSARRAAKQAIFSGSFPALRAYPERLA
jgi:hypothetical protein